MARQARCGVAHDSSPHDMPLVQRNMLMRGFESAVASDASMLDAGCWIMRLLSFIVRSSIVDCNVRAVGRLRRPNM